MKKTELFCVSSNSNLEFAAQRISKMVLCAVPDLQVRNWSIGYHYYPVENLLPYQFQWPENPVPHTH